MIITIDNQKKKKKKKILPVQVRRIFMKTNKLCMYKIIISDDRGYHGYCGPTHFGKTRLFLTWLFAISHHYSKNNSFNFFFDLYVRY